MNSMTKRLFNEDDVPVRLLLGLHEKESDYRMEDALFDVIRYMQASESESISKSTLQYALHKQMDDAWKEDFLRWCTSNGYLSERVHKTKKSYIISKSPYL